jgi:hypothetical protein
LVEIRLLFHDCPPNQQFVRGYSASWMHRLRGPEEVYHSITAGMAWYLSMVKLKSSKATTSVTSTSTPTNSITASRTRTSSSTASDCCRYRQQQCHCSCDCDSLVDRHSDLHPHPDLDWYSDHDPFSDRDSCHPVSNRDGSCLHCVHGHCVLLDLKGDPVSRDQ